MRQQDQGLSEFLTLSKEHSVGQLFSMTLYNWIMHHFWTRLFDVWGKKSSQKIKDEFLPIFLNDPFFSTFLIYCSQFENIELTSSAVNLQSWQDQSLLNWALKIYEYTLSIPANPGLDSIERIWIISGLKIMWSENPTETANLKTESSKLFLFRSEFAAVGRNKPFELVQKIIAQRPNSPTKVESHSLG